MTVPSTTRRAGPFTGTGALVAYPFTFKVFAKQDLAVTIADANGLETDLVLDSSFTTTLNVDQEATPGGTVNYAVGGVATALPLGYTLVVTGDGLEFEQTADLPQGGNFSPVVIENALDRIVMLLQRLWDGVRRSMRLPDTASDSVSTVLPVPTANNFIGWDQAGTALQNVDPNTLATVVAFAAWQSQAFSGDGVTTQFTLSSNPGNVNNLDVVVGAVPQRNNVDFTLSGTTLTFDVAPANGLSIFVRWGQALPEGTSTLQTRLYSTASAADGAGLVKFDPSLNYTLQTLGWVNKQGAINVSWFTGADNTGATDNTAIFSAAALLGHAIYVPAGTWAINWRTTNKIVIVGDGSNSTFIKPFNSATAAITYAASSPSWTYHSQVRDLCFLGTASVGVGFAFGQTVFANYTSGDEYMNNVTFSCVRFKLLEKGVLCPYGNIGKQFYNCSFSECTYGIYSIDAKFGGLMHAGNLYVYGGEMSRCQCAVYIHNVTDGFGGVVFDGVIFEYNSISTYIYTNNTFTPVEFRNCWNEQNGVISGTGSPVSLDQWSGSTRTTTNFTARAHIFDGSNSRYTYTGGRVSDFYLKATNTEVVCIESRAERTAGVGGANCTVDDANSQIRMVDPMTDKGAPFGRGMITEGAQRIVSGYTIDSNSGSASSRWMQIPHRYHKATSYGDLASSAVLPLTGSTNLDAGSFAAIPGSVVSDGIIYGSCNQWTVPFTTSSQFMQLTGSSITTTAGWYVCTIDLKITSGSCLFYLWDRSTVQMAAGADLQSGEWVTLAAMAYSPGSQSFYFDVRGNAVSVTFRASAFQLKHFATQADAEQFLKSMVYIAS